MTHDFPTLPGVLSGRRIVVTGASSGIGRAIASAAAGHGTEVFAIGRHPERLAAVAATSPAIHPVAADVTTTAGRRAIATAVEHRGGRLDGVVHCAGMLGVPGVGLATYPETEWRAVFEVNVNAMHLLHRELAPALDAGEAPVVIAVGSTVGRAPRPGWGAYAVSKYALEGWVALLAMEWTGGRVYSVNPGGTRTPMRAEARPDEDPATVPDPAEITPLFLRLLHPAAPEPSGAVLEARDWIGRDPWAGLV
jgi:NAD(P)-dependent dehydrogenase (short-subunit alcohol dehydrogenase family)